MIKSFGQLPSGKRLSRIQASPNYRDGSFQNIYPTQMLAEGASYPKMMRQFLFGKQPNQEPPQALVTVKENLKTISPEVPSITWFGHSSYLLTLNGKFILIDPVFSQRASPFQSMGSKAFPFTETYTIDDLPDPDLVILTHDHYDHLDHGVMLKLGRRAKAFAVSLGVGAHLESWGVDPAKIREFDWWESAQVLPGIELTATPARHFSGRVFTRGQSLWSSFILKGGGKKVFVGGDSGYDGSFAKIGSHAGGFDFAILECGQYDAQWPNIHMMPEETVQAAVDLKTSTMMAVHWGKFKLANHAWSDPIVRAYAKATELKMPIATPRIGQRMLLDQLVVGRPWWG
ncbi:MAG: MBL fold metallo-hydrolase [Cyclobacteriaceae bacterium]|nr:MBL fold metallo-hydrolase [Cyclobacteriaceae bacterium]